MTVLNPATRQTYNNDRLSETDRLWYHTSWAGLRHLAEDICSVGLQASLASLDAALAAGSVPSQLLNELECKLSTCISMVEMQHKS